MLELRLCNQPPAAEASDSDTNANANTRKFQLGPGGNGRVQVRFSGPDPATLRALAGQAEIIVNESGKAIGVRTDWRQPEKVVRPKVLELQANRNGLTRVDVAQTLESGFEGRTVGFFRQAAGTATGIFPQETRFLPIIARPPLAERLTGFVTLPPRGVGVPGTQGGCCSLFCRPQFVPR